MAPLLPARWWRLPDGPAGTTVVQGAFARNRIGEVLTRLVAAGAVEIIETPIAKLLSA